MSRTWSGVLLRNDREDHGAVHHEQFDLVDLGEDVRSVVDHDVASLHSGRAHLPGLEHSAGAGRVHRAARVLRVLAHALGHRNATLELGTLVRLDQHDVSERLHDLLGGFALLVEQLQAVAHRSTSGFVTARLMRMNASSKCVRAMARLRGSAPESFRSEHTFEACSRSSFTLKSTATWSLLSIRWPRTSVAVWITGSCAASGIGSVPGDFGCWIDLLGEIDVLADAGLVAGHQVPLLVESIESACAFGSGLARALDLLGSRTDTGLDAAVAILLRVVEPVRVEVLLPALVALAESVPRGELPRAHRLVAPIQRRERPQRRHVVAVVALALLAIAGDHLRGLPDREGLFEDQALRRDVVEQHDQRPTSLPPLRQETAHAT